MKFTVLGSGSTGNAVLISSENTHVLVDAGLSAREILRRLGEVGVDKDSLAGVLITHEHSDHAGGLRVLMSSIDCPVFISDATRDSYLSTRAASKNGETESARRRTAIRDRSVSIESSREFRIGDIDFLPFSVPHDAADNFGFVAINEGVRVATLMDFGHINDLIREHLRDCDGIVIESNHDRDMLRACAVYTWELKQRIMSRTGHLCNEDLADWLSTEFDGRARHIVLAHLSQRANDKHLARLTAETALKMRSPLFRAETEISVSDPKTPTEWFRF